MADQQTMDVLQKMLTGDPSLTEDIAAALDASRSAEERLDLAYAFVGALWTVVTAKHEALLRALIEREALLRLTAEQSEELRRLRGGGEQRPKPRRGGSSQN